MKHYLSTWRIPLNSTAFLFKSMMKLNFLCWYLSTEAVYSNLHQVRVPTCWYWSFSLEHMTWFHSSNMNNSKCIKSLQTLLSNIDLILHINMTIVAWLVPQLNASTSFFTLARFFGAKLSLALHPCLVPRSLSLLSSPSEAIKSHLMNHPFICIVIFFISI